MKVMHFWALQGQSLVWLALKVKREERGMFSSEGISNSLTMGNINKNVI